MPRQFASAATGSRTRTGSSRPRGDRRCILVMFGGDTTALIPLYSVGVFVCFTLSQIGMVRHWYWSTGAAGGRRATNAVGAVLTFVVAWSCDREVHRGR